jgi:hypothetical protein
VVRETARANHQHEYAHQGGEAPDTAAGERHDAEENATDRGDGPRHDGKTIGRRRRLIGDCDDSRSFYVRIEPHFESVRYWRAAHVRDDGAAGERTEHEEHDRSRRGKTRHTAGDPRDGPGSSMGSARWDHDRDMSDPFV